VLVCGLLAVGVAAAADNLFELAGRQLERVPGPPIALLAAGYGAVAVVTAVLNLDTAVVFLTPVLIHAARARGSAEEPFLYGAVLMANASSLYLPGSNLTNLLVLAHAHLTGPAFAAKMALPALAATLVTAVGLVALCRRSLHAGGPRAGLDMPAQRPFIGGAAVLAAAVLTVALRNAALAVLAVGVVALAAQLARRRIVWRGALRAVGPVTLSALFVLAVALGTLARAWDGPAQLLSGTGSVGSASVAALTSVIVNNLPAAVLLSARAPAHPAALLVGLNLGPNLAASGSLSAILWIRAARSAGASPSLRRYSQLGLVLAPAAIFAALAAGA
jgi:arsenical pump membrane protein